MGITIGNKNKIINSNFVEKSNVTVPLKKEGFFSKVAVNITSNLIWWLLGLLLSGGVIATITVLWNEIINVFK